jgi:putative nucleotidyltransferase with HDIG domain
MDRLGITSVVLSEIAALHGVGQSRYHHRDVHGHTLEALQRVIALQRFADGAEAVQDAESVENAESVEDAAAFDLALGGQRQAVSAVLAEPLADQLTRGEALRWGALLHDAAKPLTAATRPDGRITFMGHDQRGAQLARDVLARLRVSERLRAHVAALVRHHLRLGFLVHQPQPLAQRTVFNYLISTSPVEVDVTLLSIADRLATRGERAPEAIDAHLRLARPMLADALRWRAEGPPTPLWRGDELARALDIPIGPRIGELLRELAAAQYAGEVSTRDGALDHARAVLTR